MKKKPYNRIGEDVDKLTNILSLRLAGWSFVSLADLYHCDRASLRYQCRKYQIFPIKTVYVRNSKEVFNIERILHTILLELEPKRDTKWYEIEGERINTGKSYRDYLNSPYNLATN